MNRADRRGNDTVQRRVKRRATSASVEHHPRAGRPEVAHDRIDQRTETTASSRLAESETTVSTPQNGKRQATLSEVDVQGVVLRPEKCGMAVA